MLLRIDEFPESALPAMQTAHAEEVTMINLLDESLRAVEAGHGDVSLVTARLAALLVHTREHFAEEERLMQQHGFPPYPVHKGAHDQLLNDMERLVAEWQHHGDTAPLARFLRETLPGWMREHIATMDLVTAAFLAERTEAG